ncbi:MULTISPECIES: sulfotransferase family protein [Actinomadura]|uniref:Sulfotransferase family protein n=1 Tax=Actinomadura litoris TaxID=2678616 RepID=A0A7K1L513_9ACTN|nr:MULTISPECIES: sulfotransferase family protein [Actinomadura]MBT2212545.1 sulfotransferase family protein [Actinomadura sp. NEAU-AAG7]MUN39522.1 sulfotransferase family protein [Actinomadura litoris]
MKVIGAGFGRTGTASLRTALEMLGQGPCYHMRAVIEEPFRIRQWLDVADGAPPDWDTMLAGFQSAVDWPSAAYWRELAEHFPEAKVLLTVRDPERWYESANATIFAANRQAWGDRRPLLRRILGRLARWRHPDLPLFPTLIRKIVLEGALEGRSADRAYILGLFERHIEEVKAAIPADRLLVYEVREGWEPLCAFLGVPVPDEPFPRENDREAFQRAYNRVLLRLILHRRARPQTPAHADS